MLLAIVPKQPAEEFVIAFNFGRDLAAGETIAARTVRSKRRDDGQDSTGV